MSRASSASVSSSSPSFHVGSSSVVPVDEKEYERLHKILESRRNVMRVGLKELDLTARSLRAINMARKRSAKDSTKGHHLFYRLRKEELKASRGDTDSQSTADLIAKINAEWAAMSKEQKEAYDVTGPEEKLHPKVLAIKKRKQLADEEVGQDAVSSASSSSKGSASRKRRKAPAAVTRAVEEQDDNNGDTMEEKEEEEKASVSAKKKAAKKKHPARAASSKKASSVAGGEKRKSRSKRAVAEGADSSAAAVAPVKKGRSRGKSASGSGAAGKQNKGGESVSSDD
jgi:hypothetical protein